jgi:small-conductance mechanosensitive channel
VYHQARLLTLLLGFAWIGAGANAALGAAVEPNDLEVAAAPVIVDGRTLFRVRGGSSYPPEERAEAIENRIIALARDPSVDVRDIRVVESPTSSDLMAGQRRIMSVLNADATLEGFDRRVMAAQYQERVRRCILEFRASRSPAALKSGAIRATIATAVFVVGLWLVLRSTNRLRALLESRYRPRVRTVSIQSFHILHAQQIWSAVQVLLRFARVAAVLIFCYIYLEYVLSQFPWTRPLAQRLLGYLISPLETMGRTFLDHLPDLIFLAVLLLVARYVLRLIRLFFDAVVRGGVTLGGFQPEWAAPSYRLARLAVIVLTAVVAYPYIPGSGSEAFKGISILLGVMFSIGSSSFLSNIVAGYALIYRRAFKVGDRVQIDDVVGDVVELRLQATHLRTLKSEEVIVPNSLILNSKVVNFSSLAGKHGLILHTTVGIGYEIAWRKVEVMLLDAAARTQGLLRSPAPFVLRKHLGEFAVTYELNVYCADAQATDALYSTLHSNILDVFNENRVQIMTPAYEGDPPEPKIAPQDSSDRTVADVPAVGGLATK